MLFAYIDSQGKEVGIPSVDALQLRIELGAIMEETMFFDARSGKWARAGEHEIFRTLVREAGEEKPFPGAPSVEHSPALSLEGDEEHEHGPPPAASDPEAPAAAASAEGPEREEMDVLDPGSLLDLAEAPEDSTEEFDDFDLSGFESNTSQALEDDPDAAPGLEWESLPPMEEVQEDDGDVSGAAAPAEGGPAGGGTSSRRDVPSSPPGWFEAGPEEGGLELEEAWKAGASSAGPHADGDDAAVSGSVGSAGGEPEAVGHDTADSGAVGSGAAEPDAAGHGPAHSGAADHGAVARGADRRVPEASSAPDGAEPARPAARPARSGRGSRGTGRRIAVAAILVLAGAAGWFGWSVLGGQPGTEEMEAAVVVPDLPPELEEVHAQARPGAVEALVEVLRADAADLPEAPDPDWLGGEYLASASAFPGVGAYWTSLGAYIRGVREREADVFAEVYARELEGLSVPGPTSRDRLLERADAAFRAARAERTDAYDRLDTLIAASLDLHEFLQANEEQIKYEPTAGGFSRDPVTEAIPATQELGDEMWSRVSRITAAMDALGTVDRLTTQGLVDFVLQRVARTPIQ